MLLKVALSDTQYQCSLVATMACPSHIGYLIGMNARFDKGLSFISMEFVL